MKKICTCGAEMEITIRTVYFKRNIKIENVPVYSCPVCENHQLLEQSKVLMKEMIEEFDERKEKDKVIPFEEKCELGQLLVMAYHQQEHPYIEETIQEDVQDLLDELMIEGESEESYLTEEIRKKIEKYVH
ncbi:YgiT-type zinc finger protein [Tepidibacillus sp. LV47]|uniref:YgiT-type zinc finger protein n=1 Tax=Tepidibacillus sp. LV47 TaxID=3398228 RepID=UPI003AABE6B8